MGNSNDLSNRINEAYSTLSKGQKLLASYITDNYDKAVFLTAAKLGEVVGVSESTVVRFATHLGYKGYPDFQKALEELVRNKLNSVQRMEVAYGRISQSKILESVLQSDAERIKESIEMIDPNAFDMAVETILNAKRIYIVGIRSCAPLAGFFAFYLNMMFDDVRLLSTNSSSELFEQMVRISKDDVIIGISFPRYSMRTLKAMEFANNRSAKVITLTDSVHSPMNLYSSCNLIAKSDMASIVDSLVAPLSVINALIVALCMKKQGEVVNTLEMLEDIWDEYQVYESDEINYIDILDCNAGDHGYPFATNFNPEINIREVSANGSYWEDGHWVETKPMEIKRVYNFPEVGEKDMYLLHHEELESLGINIPGIKRIRFFMTFGQSYLTHLKCLENVGMTSIEPIEFEGKQIVPLQFLKAVLPDPASLGPRTVGKTNIGCIFQGKKDGKDKTYYLYNVCDHQECYKEVGSQAVSYTTGVPAMIGAMMLMTGKWNKPGVYNIEEFDPDPFMDALNKFGLPWKESYTPDLVE